MINFKRYTHVEDLLEHYVHFLDRKDIKQLLLTGVKNEVEAETFSKFIWLMVEQINEDEENNIVVLGSTGNTEMLPDISYEVTQYMRELGYYGVWECISNEEI
ncbi:hypothetical protein [Aliikangiella sp. IMCC44359]|uniref:hypothetical protein n=1 Tax=Aliikangiella sp. IMCC44359 TaxID=3459125 RepID=UPI00403AFBBC